MKLPKIKINSFKNPKTALSFVLQVILVLFTFAHPLLYPKIVNANVTEAFVRFDRLTAGAPISGTACLKSTVSGQTNVVLVFPLSWTISQTASNWTVSTSNLPVDPAAGTVSPWPGIGTANTVNGANVIFPGTSLVTPGNLYCFNFVGAASTISGTAANDQAGTLKTQGGAPYVDSVNWAVSTVTPGAEQILVTASVSATMTFSINATSSALGTLTTSGAPVSGTAITQSVSTNARNGWISWIKGANTGAGSVGALHSTTANADILSPGSFNGTPEDLSAQSGYVVSAAGLSCTGCSIAAEYADAANSGGHIDPVFHETVHHTALLSAAETVNYVVKAKASAFTPAGSDYTDTLTVTAAGSF